MLFYLSKLKEVKNFLMQVHGLLEFCLRLFLPLGDLHPNTLGM